MSVSQLNAAIAEENTKFMNFLIIFLSTALVAGAALFSRNSFNGTCIGIAVILASLFTSLMRYMLHKDNKRNIHREFDLEHTDVQRAARNTWESIISSRNFFLKDHPHDLWTAKDTMMFDIIPSMVISLMSYRDVHTLWTGSNKRTVRSFWNNVTDDLDALAQVGVLQVGLKGTEQRSERIEAIRQHLFDNADFYLDDIRRAVYEHSRNN